MLSGSLIHILSLLGIASGAPTNGQDWRISGTMPAGTTAHQLQGGAVFVPKGTALISTSEANVMASFDLLLVGRALRLVAGEAYHATHVRPNDPTNQDSIHKIGNYHVLSSSAVKRLHQTAAAVTTSIGLLGKEALHAHRQDVWCSANARVRFWLSELPQDDALAGSGPRPDDYECRHLASIKANSPTALPKGSRPKSIRRTGDKFTYNQNPLLINIASRTTRAIPPASALAPLAIKYLPKIFSAIAPIVTSTAVQRIRQDLASGRDSTRTVSVAAPAISQPVQTLRRLVQRIVANPHATLADLVSYLQVSDLLALTDIIRQKIARIITDGIRYTFAPELLTSGQQTEAITRLHSTAGAAGYTTAVRDTADLHRCSASLVLGKSGRLDIIAHAPMTPSHLMMNIWNFMSIPVRTDTGMLVDFEMTTTLIAEAKGGTGHFRAITTDEWQDCQRFSTMTACHLPTTIDSDRKRHEGTDDAHCLHAIKTVQEEDIMRVCRISREPKRQVLVAIGKNEFILWSDKPTNVAISCPRQHTVHLHDLRGPVLLKLGPACTASTKWKTAIAPLAITAAEFKSRLFLTDSMVLPPIAKAPEDILTEVLRLGHLNSPRYRSWRSARLSPKQPTSPPAPARTPPSVSPSVPSASSKPWKGLYMIYAVAAAAAAAIAIALIMIVVHLKCRDTNPPEQPPQLQLRTTSLRTTTTPVRSAPPPPSTDTSSTTRTTRTVPPQTMTTTTTTTNPRSSANGSTTTTTTSRNATTSTTTETTSAALSPAPAPRGAASAKNSTAAPAAARGRTERAPADNTDNTTPNNPADEPIYVPLHKPGLYPGI